MTVAHSLLSCGNVFYWFKRREIVLITALLGGFVFLCTTRSSGGDFNAVVSIGDTAPTWKDLVGVDDKLHSLADVADKAFVLVIFTCNSCPYAVDYESRFVDLETRLGGAAGELAIIAINVNLIEEDRFAAMKQRAKERNFQFPYLFDESQAIAKAYGAARTPECFLLDGDRKIAYMGSFDDDSRGLIVTHRYVEEAIESLQNGAPVRVQETPPVGCAVRYSRSREGRKTS